MKLEKIRAASSKAGMFSIYKQHGADAVIYRTDKTPTGVEILYGLPDHLYVDDKHQSQEHEVSIPQQGLDSLSYSSGGIYQGDSVNGQLSQLNSRMSELSEMLVHINEKQVKDTDQSEQKRLWIKMLTEMGFSLSFCEKFYSHTALNRNWFKRVTKTKVIKSIKQLFSALNINTEFKEGVYVLMGSTGVGKTTTLIKLVKHYQSVFSRNDIGIITLDKEETTIKNSLSYYSSTLKIPFELASTPDDFSDALDRMRNKKIILVDTYGMNPFKNDDVEIMNLYMKKICRPHVKSLVAPCAMQEDMLNQVLSHCSKLNFNELLLTKQDESMQVGSVLASAISVKLPIRYVCNGKSIERDIYRLKTDTLIDQLITQRVSK